MKAEPGYRFDSGPRGLTTLFDIGDPDYMVDVFAFGIYLGMLERSMRVKWTYDGSMPRALPDHRTTSKALVLDSASGRCGWVTRKHLVRVE